MLASGTRLGREFSTAWNGMQAEVGEPMEGSVLHGAAADAGRYAYRVQAGLTRARERHMYEALDLRLRALPAADARRLAWMNVDSYSAAWVAAWPGPELWMEPTEFVEIACRYFGLPSPACAALVGQPISGTRSTVDCYGFRVCAAQMTGDGWRDQHDMLKWTLYEDARSSHMRPTAEVYGLFAPLLPQDARDALGELPVRRRQGIVPDFLLRGCVEAGGALRDVLAELKTLHVGVSTYPPSTERCRAVSRRAAAIQSEYVDKARALDQRWLRTLEGDMGPVENKLRSYGAIRSLVFGAFGEASSDVDWLLNQTAECAGARRHGRA
eukprot:12412817-Karenia_brevis.AAC.1